MESETGNFSSSNAPYSFEHSRNTSKKILKPIRQEKIVKVPVTQYIEKIIEKEQIKYVNKYVDVIKPIITYKTKHIPKPIYLDKIKYEPKLIEKEKIIHIPKIEYKNRIVEIPIYVHKEKIIEKKVPLIIERVIPVLKIKRIEKEVLTDTIEIPEICEITKNETNTNLTKNIYQQNIETSSKPSGEKNSYVLNLDDKKDIYNMQTYRQHEQDNEPTMHSPIQIPHSDVDKFKDHHSNSENSNGHSDGDSYKARLENKKDTGYLGISNDDTNYELISENENRIINAENNSKEYVKRLMEDNYYNVEERGKNINTTRVSIHLPTTHNAIPELVEKNYINSYESNRNVSLNNVIDNKHIIENGSIYNRYAGDSTNELLNQNEIQEHFNGSKVYSSIPMHVNDPGSYRSIAKDHIEAERTYGNSSNMHISYENYAPSQNAYSPQSVISKSNFRPSYANSNGQAIVSVRPATILEYKPNPRKNKTSICSFMNNCCGANE